MKDVELSEYAGETTQRSFLEAPSYELDRSQESFHLPFNYAPQQPSPVPASSKRFKSPERKGKEVMLEQLLALQEQRYVEETKKLLKAIANEKFRLVLTQVSFMWQIKPLLAASENNLKMRSFYVWKLCLKRTDEYHSKAGEHRIAMTLGGVYKRHMMKHFTGLKEKTEAASLSRIVSKAQIFKTPSPKTSRPISPVSARTEVPSRFFGSPSTSTISRLDDTTKREFKRAIKGRFPEERKLGDSRSLV